MFRIATTLIVFTSIHVTMAQTSEEIFANYDSKFIEEVIQLEFNVGEDMVMLRGHSPVSYFESGIAEKGSSAFKSSHQNVVYYFTNAEQKSKFDENPAIYLPQYGGYCAYGVAFGKHLDADPESFKIIDDQLYLFLLTDDVKALELWNARNEQKQLEDANANWEVLRLLPDDE